MESRSKNSKRNIFAGLISSFSVFIFGFLTRTAVIYTFNEQYSGLTSVFTSILSVLNLAELGFSSAVIVNLYEPLENRDIEIVCAILNYYRRVYRIIGTIILSIGLIAMPFLPIFINGEKLENINIYIFYLIYLMDTSISYFLFSYKSALLSALQRFDIVKVIHTGIYILKGILQMFAILVANSIYLYAVVLLIGTILNSVFLQYVSLRKYPQYICKGSIGQEQKNNINKQVVGLSISKVAQVARNSLDSMVLSAFLGLSVVAVYNNYYYIYNAVLSIIWILAEAIQASIGNSIVSESLEKNFNDLRVLEFIYGCIISICTALMICLYQPFMTLWMKGKLLLETKDMLLFGIYFYCISMNTVRNLYFQGDGLWWKGRRYSILEVLGNLTLDLFLGYFLGVTGILLATIITIVLINYICNTNLLFREYFKISPKIFYMDRIYYTLVTVVGCAAAYYACRFFHENSYVGLIKVAFSSFGISTVVCLSFHLIFKKKIMCKSFYMVKTVFLKC